MWRFLLSGGFGVWVVLLFGLLSLAAAVVFLVRPHERRLGVIRALSRATLYAIAAAVSAGLAAVGTKVPAHPQWAHSPDLPLVVMMGIAETLTNAILGFALLALVWFFVAVGRRRLDRSLAG